MIFISFLISYAGFFAVHSIDSRFFQSISSKIKLSIGTNLFFSLVVSICGAFFSISLLQQWIFFGFLIIVATQFEKILRWKRKSELKTQTMGLLDEMILIIKGGGSIKQAAESSQRSTGGWFLGFSAELKKCLELGNEPDTESKWFNNFISEVVEIQNSRVKTVDQLTAVRRSIRSEIYFEKKCEQVLSGPRFQMKFMTAVFFALNLMFILNHAQGPYLKLLISAWIFFLGGIILSHFIIKGVKWKI